MRQLHLWFITFISIIMFSFNAYADPSECQKHGCSARQCAEASQNGYSCKAWKCFGRCMRTKGFYGSCYEQPSKLQACTEANHAFESKCKYQ